MSATSGGGGSVSEGSEAGGSSQSTMSVSDSPSTSFQANLAPDNVTKITLSEESSARGYTADVTGSKINLTLDERHQKDGIVNVAFDYEEETNRGSGGGEFRSMNGSEKKDKIPEAVNLELVNMVPYSNGNGTNYGVPLNGIPGIPTKKDSEQVDMSTPYDEYFVPVNEHKKYMRGEKLYVTKDKRRPTSWRRCLSWLVACTVISVVLIVAILAGTGVILSQDTNLLKDASVGRNFGGSNLKPSVTDKSPTPTAEMFVFVPRSIESEFVIDNLDFDPALRDLNSSAYKEFSNSMEDQLKMLLFDKQTLELGSSDIGVKVVNISRNPFKVNYRIGWNYKQGVSNPPEPIKMEDVKKRLVESLAKNQGYINKYHIDKEAIKVNHVINKCRMENGGCSHICYYNYITQQFTCTCPTHLVLDNNGKNCVAWSGSSDDDALPVPSHTAHPGLPYESTPRSVKEDDYNSSFQRTLHQGVHHHHETDFEHSPDSDYESRINHEPTAEPIPEPAPEPGRGQQHKSSEDIQAKPEPISESYGDENNTDTLSSLKTDGVNTQSESIEPNIYSSHESTGTESFPEPSAEPSSEDKHHNYVHSVQGSEPVAEPESEPEPTAEPLPEGKGLDAIHSGESKDNESPAEPTPEPVSEPTAESDLGENQNHNHKEHSLHEFIDHEPTAEPSPAGEDRDHIVHSKHEIGNPEPIAEPTPEPVLKSTAQPNREDEEHIDHSVYHSENHESVKETLSRGHDQDHSVHFMLESKDHEPAAEPTPEPAPEPTVESNVEGKNHDLVFSYESKSSKAAAEPATEAAPQDHKEYVVHSVDESKDYEPVTESNAEPSPEGKEKEYNGHSKNETKDGLLEATANSNYDAKLHSFHGFVAGDRTAENNFEPAQEPTPESLADSDHQTYSPMHNVGGSEHFETTIHPPLSQDHMNSDLSSSLENSQHPSQNEEKRQNTEFKTEHPGMQSVPNEDKLRHHVPYLQDVLVRRPGSDLEKENATSHGENVLQNVELTASGKPIIEEVIIDKSDAKGQDEVKTFSPSMSTGFKTHTNNKSDLSNPKTKEGSHDPKSEDIDFSLDNSTNDPDFIIKQSDEPDAPSGSKFAPSEIENATDGPAIIEQNAMLQKGYEGKEMSNLEGVGHIKSPNKNNESVVTINNENLSEAFNSRTSHFDLDGTRLNSDDRTDAENKSMNIPPVNVLNTTFQPEIRHVLHMRPVAVDFSGSHESGTNLEKNSKQGTQMDMSESNTKAEKPHISDETNPGDNQEITKIAMDSNSDTSPTGGQLDQTKVFEIATEQYIPMTTLFSVLSPESDEKKINGKLTIDKENRTDLRKIDFENKTMDQNSHLESNETTKTPEELSNNIKDELLENEEFNTLIDKGYSIKESDSNDNKEVGSKYSRKPQKVDKKKIKDYTKIEKVDSDKKIDVTAKPGVTPEDYILQKHVNGNEYTFDLDYSLPNEHTTKHDGEVTVIDPHGFDGTPGVSFKPHGINNHDLSVLQTVAPDFRTETIQPHGLETLKPDPKIKLLENKEGELRQDKDYPKFDKDYKYEKQKVSKKKDLKKKGGGGKDAKNVELDDGRKYFTEISKEDLEVSHEVVKDISETTVNPSFEKITLQPDIGVRVMTGSSGQETIMPEYQVILETTTRPSHTVTFEVKTELSEDVTEHSGQFKSVKDETTDSAASEEPAVRLQDNEREKIPLNQNYHQMIDEPSVKTISSISPGTVYDGKLFETVKPTDSKSTFMNMNSTSPSTNTEHEGIHPGISNATLGTVFDGIPESTTPFSSASNAGFELYSSLGSAAGQNISFVTSEVVTDGGVTLENGLSNSTAANPTIIIRGQSGNLQGGHTMRFVNSTFYSPVNATVISFINGTVRHPEGHSFTFTNYTATFPNGSIVHPTINVRGRSGTLQDGHETRFGNSTFVTPLPSSNRILKNSTVYRIENGSLPGTVFDGHFNPADGHYHMLTNSSGTFAYSNETIQPAFIIKGKSGDFGNSTAYIVANDSGGAGGSTRSFSGPSVIFRNSTVFEVRNADGSDIPTASIQEITVQPHNVTSDEKIHYTNQLSSNRSASKTNKVNNYFGVISKCAAGQFQCVNGTSKRGSACISLSSKCDSINDCSDGSDELGCIENGCPGNFQCSDGSCLKRSLVCNGILDCIDGSDEKQCENWKCEFDEFQCPSGRCIPVVWQCDGKPDCENHTDEYNCQTSCDNDEYLCPEGWCIPLTYKCNNIKECSNGEDEQLCDCSHEEFKCGTGGCVSMKQICDGLEDCPDRSDEWECVILEPKTNLLKIRTPAGKYEPVCADNWLSQYSDEVCASLGYYSSVPIESENSSSITTETSFFILKNGSTDNFNKKVILNLKKSEGNCFTGKLVEIACQDFTCGSRSMTDSSSVEARLVGGMSAAAGQWPSVALLYNIRNFHSCTANILTPKWVLVSYNCLKMGNKNLNEQDWKFFGGSTVFEAEKENAERRKILAIIPHPQVKFNQFLFSNDLALVQLDQSLQFTSSLGAVCLPEQEMQPRQICVTAGWGINSPKDKSIRQQLQYMPVPTMNLTECNSTEHYSGFITNDKICAGYNSAQKSLCYNEEGAPLMCVNDRGEWELQGVLSYHSNCGRGSHPSIFSSITPVAGWIRKTIGNTLERKSVAVTKR